MAKYLKRDYRIAGMFGGVNVCRITELKVIDEIKFGEWIDFGHKVLLLAKIWLVKVWRITDYSPNSPNFPAAKHSRYTVFHCVVLNIIVSKTTFKSYMGYNVLKYKAGLNIKFKCVCVTKCPLMMSHMTFYKHD